MGRFRKSAWLTIALFLLIAARTLYQEWQEQVVRDSSTDKGRESFLQLEIGATLVDGRPLRRDRVFYEGRDRVYALSDSLTAEGLMHLWYFGSVEVARFSCPSAKPCVSSLSSDSLRVGFWSVDVVRGRELLASGQFHIVSP